MKACVSETLSTLGQHFGQLLELALTREVQVSAGWAVEGHTYEFLGKEGRGVEPGWRKLPKRPFLGDILFRSPKLTPAPERQDCQRLTEAS